MKTKEFFLERMTIEEFGEKHNLTMEIHERSSEDSPTRFYAHFTHSDLSDGHFLVGTYGNGHTPQEAVRNYAKEISGKLLVIDAWGKENRREIVVPVLTGAK